MWQPLRTIKLFQLCATLAATYLAIVLAFEIFTRYIILVSELTIGFEIYGRLKETEKSRNDRSHNSSLHAQIGRKGTSQYINGKYKVIEIVFARLNHSIDWKRTNNTQYLIAFDDTAEKIISQFEPKSERNKWKDLQYGLPWDWKMRCCLMN